MELFLEENSNGVKENQTSQPPADTTSHEDIPTPSEDNAGLDRENVQTEASETVKSDDRITPPPTDETLPSSSVGGEQQDDAMDIESPEDIPFPSQPPPPGMAGEEEEFTPIYD